MILDHIVAYKQKEVQETRRRLPLEALREISLASLPAQPFSAGLRAAGRVTLIAEIKKASPSKGLIRADFDPAAIAETYTTAGASAVSVLTDREFFQGRPGYLKEVRNVTDLPLLRKDFIIDPYQVYEARFLGADAVLLILAVLTDEKAEACLWTAADLGMECLVEVHNNVETARALQLGAGLIGINNRDLHTFKTDLEVTFRLREQIDDPRVIVISESGIHSREDVERLKRAGVDSMLVGEALMKEADIAGKVRELIGPDLRSAGGIDDC